jgi:hypothetical protein
MMNNKLVVFSKVLISAALFCVCYWGITQGSSDAFKLGLGAGFMGLFIWVYGFIPLDFLD